MITIAKLLCVIPCILITAGCEDDPVFPSPAKTDKYPPEELLVSVRVPFESEFDVAFSKTTYYEIGSLLGNDLWTVVYWWGVEPGQPIYLLEAYGNGENAVIGNFYFQMSTIWLTEEISFSSSKITSENMGSLNIQFKDNTSDLTSDYPYDRMSYEKNFLFTGGQGKLAGSDGDGQVKLIVSDSVNYLIRLKWNGILNLVISR